MHSQSRKYITKAGVGLLAILSLFWLASRVSNLWMPKQYLSSVTCHDLDQTWVEAHFGEGTPDLKFRVVTTASSIEQGLSGQSVMPGDGMLFLLPVRSQPSFWMKEMLFDLDLIWLDEWRVVEVSARVPAPAPTTPLAQLPTYAPRLPVTQVLEVPAGFVTAHQLEVGNELFVPDLLRHCLAP